MADAMTLGSEITLPPSSRYLGARITITRTDDSTATGRLIAVTETGIELELDDGKVTVAPYSTTTSARLAGSAAAPVAEPMTDERLAELRDLIVDSTSADAPYNPDIWALEQARKELLAEVDRLRKAIRVLADDWEPAPHSFPEDRWDRGHDAAGREIAQQLRVLITEVPRG
ncbi:LSm family protein [Actinomadura geliboluensis]|uniref:hypothetical protein n=1 Tax=Actinomadura geliboluensis TaxID=882440 RepID=UPI0036B6DE84